MNLKSLFRGSEHSDNVPLDVVSPVAELRLFLSGEIDRNTYDQALERSDEALVEGWQTDDSDSAVYDDTAAPAGA